MSASTPDVAIVRQAIESAPKDYELSGKQELSPLAVRAAIDGSGAAASFLPALQLIAPGGQVMWTAVTSSALAAGASADVSWFPRVGGGGGDGIRFDTLNVGDWLNVEATSATGVTLSTSDAAAFFRINAAHRIYLDAVHSLNLEAEQGDLNLAADLGSAALTAGTFVTVQAQTGEHFQPGNGDFEIHLADTNDFVIYDGPATFRFRVRDSLSGSLLIVYDTAGAPIFEVHADGSIHGLASVGAITWDL